MIPPFSVPIRYKGSAKVFCYRNENDALADIDGRKLLLKRGGAETLTFRESESALPVRIMTASEAGSPRLVRQSS